VGHELGEQASPGAAAQVEPQAQVEATVAAGETSADSSLIEWMLDLTPEQRLEALQGFVDSVWELRGGREA
jgi:hypothetical protein